MDSNFESKEADSSLDLRHYIAGENNLTALDLITLLIGAAIYENALNMPTETIVGTDDGGGVLFLFLNDASDNELQIGEFVKLMKNNDYICNDNKIMSKFNENNATHMCVCENTMNIINKQCKKNDLSSSNTVFIININQNYARLCYEFELNIKNNCENKPKMSLNSQCSSNARLLQSSILDLVAQNRNKLWWLARSVMIISFNPFQTTMAFGIESAMTNQISKCIDLYKMFHLCNFIKQGTVYLNDIKERILHCLRDNIIPMDLKCSICFDLLNEASSIGNNECTHVFCKQCIQQWYNISSNKTCPLCRRDINQIVLNNQKNMEIIEFVNDSLPQVFTQIEHEFTNCVLRKNRGKFGRKLRPKKENFIKEA